jgi:hypothetical protein
MVSYHFTGEWHDISLHWRVSWCHITSLESVMMSYHFTGECHGVITSLESVMMTYHVTGECHDVI